MHGIFAQHFAIRHLDARVMRQETGSVRISVHNVSQRQLSRGAVQGAGRASWRVHL